MASTAIQLRAETVAQTTAQREAFGFAWLPILIQILQVTIPALVQCLGAQTPAELGELVRGSRGAEGYDDRTLRRVSSLIKLKALGQGKIIGSRKARIIAEDMLDDACSQPDDVVAAVYRESMAPIEESDRLAAALNED